MIVNYTDHAKQDMADMWHHIANESNQSTATQFAAAVLATVEILSGSPHMGVKRPVIAQDVRVIFHAPYALYYCVKVEEIIILRVVHGSRDLDTIMKEGGFEIRHMS